MIKAFTEETVWRAAQNGDLDRVKIFIEQNEKLVNSKDEDGRTPIHWASSTGKDAVVLYLLEKGANPDSEDESGWTPLCSACSSGYETTVKILLTCNKPVNVNHQNETGRTPLHYASSKSNDKIVKILLDMGAKPNITDSVGANALHRGVATHTPSLLKASDKIVELLLPLMNSVDARNKYGETALHIACIENNEISAVRLVRAGADLLAENGEKKNALELSQEELRERLVELAKRIKSNTDIDS